jgi:transposase
MFAAPAFPDLSTLNADALRSLLLDHHQQLLSNNSEIEHLKLVIAKLRRMIFGAKSERVEREIEQLELKLEEMGTVRAEPAVTQRTSLNDYASKPSRRPLPEHLPREVHTHMPTVHACPECGGELRKFGEDISEMLEYVPSSFKVVRHVRPKLSCHSCEKVVQAEAPSRPIDRGIPVPSLLAHVLVAKYADHLPLYRQSEIYAREGVDLDRSTLADWVGAASKLLRPLVEEVSRHVTAATKLQATILRCQCSPRATARRKQAGSGRMSAMIGQRTIPRHRQSGSPTLRTAKASIRAGI